MREREIEGRRGKVGRSRLDDINTQYSSSLTMTYASMESWKTCQ